MDVPMDTSVDSSEDITGTQQLKKMATKRKGRGLDRNHGAFDEDKTEVEDVENEKGEGEQKTRMVPSKSVDGWLVFVKSLNEEVTEQDVKDKFIDFGRIKGINLHINRMTGYPMGTAIVEYANFKDALNAIRSLNGTTWLGMTLKVGWCFMEKAKTK